MTSPSALPSRELDALVEEHVMGTALTKGQRARGVRIVARPYSTDMRAMGAVLDALRERGWLVIMATTHIGWNCMVTNGMCGYDEVTLGDVDANTLPRAVCLAALAAVGGK